MKEYLLLLGHGIERLRWIEQTCLPERGFGKFSFLPLCQGGESRRRLALIGRVEHDDNASRDSICFGMLFRCAQEQFLYEIALLASGRFKGWRLRWLYGIHFHGFAAQRFPVS
jgi:hypothetical protein